MVLTFYVQYGESELSSRPTRDGRPRKPYRTYGMYSTRRTDRSPFNVSWRTAIIGLFSLLSCHCVCGKLLKVARANKVDCCFYNASGEGFQANTSVAMSVFPIHVLLPCLLQYLAAHGQMPIPCSVRAREERYDCKKRERKMLSLRGRKDGWTPRYRGLEGISSGGS